MGRVYKIFLSDKNLFEKPALIPHPVIEHFYLRCKTPSIKSRLSHLNEVL